MMAVRQAHQGQLSGETRLGRSSRRRSVTKFAVARYVVAPMPLSAEFGFSKIAGAGDQFG